LRAPLPTPARASRRFSRSARRSIPGERHDARCDRDRPAECGGHAGRGQGRAAPSA
jgi:hypothetical protein